MSSVVIDIATNLRETRAQTVILNRLDEADKKDRRTMDGARTWAPRLCFLQKVAGVCVLASAAAYGTYVVQRLTHIERQLNPIAEKAGVQVEK